MPKVVFLFCCLLGYAGVWAQSPEIDSLLNALSGMENDSNKVNTHLALSKAYNRNHFEEAMYHLNQAFFLAEEMPYNYGLAKARCYRGSLYAIAGLYEKSTEDLLASIDYFGQRKDTSLLAQSYSDLAATAYMTEHYDQAMHYMDEALKIYQARQDTAGILRMYNNKAATLFQAGKPEEAMQLYRNNLKLEASYSYPLMKAMGLNNLGMNLTDIGQPDSAIHYINLSVLVYKDMNNHYGLATAYHNLGEAHVELGNLKEAERYLEMSEAIDKEHGPFNALSENTFLKSEILEAKGQYKAALAAYKEFHDEREKQEEEGRLREAHELRAAFAADRKLNQLEQERDMHKERVALHQAELARQNAENKNQRQWIYSFIAGFVILLVFVGFQIYNTRGRRKVNAELRAQQKETQEKNKALRGAQKEIQKINRQLQASNSNLEATVADRTEELSLANLQLTVANENLDTFIYRFSHDLRGPIARLKGLAQLAQAQEDNLQSTAYLQLMNVACDRMDQALRKLILVRELPKMDDHPAELDLEEILVEIRTNLLELNYFGDLQIHLKEQATRPFVQDREKIRLILENLIENAWQFRARSEDAEVEVEVELVQLEESWQLKVCDRGIGIDPEYRSQVFDLFFRGSPRSLGNGVGLYLVRELVHSLDGEIIVESDPGNFTLFEIEIKAMKAPVQTLESVINQAPRT